MVPTEIDDEVTAMRTAAAFSCKPLSTALGPNIRHMFIMYPSERENTAMMATKPTSLVMRTYSR